MAFPASPADGATTLVNGVTYVYSLANVSWSPVASVNSLAVSALTVSGNSSVTGTETVGTSVVTGNESVQGNETVSGTLSIGSVGTIGTLTVSGNYGAVSGTFAGGVSAIRVTGSTSAFSEPRIDLGETTLSPTAYIASKNQGNGGGALIFGNRDTSSVTSTLTERVRIDASGNVGIGTSSPSRKLDIEQSSTDYQMRIGDTGSNYYDIGRNTTNGLLTFYGSQAVASGYKFSTVNGDRLTIDTSGNVIIGTTSTIGSTNFSAGSVVYSSIQQGGRSYEAHDFNSYPNLYSSIFINPGASSNVPTGFTGNGYRFIMGAGDTTTRGFDLLGSSEPALWFRERLNGVWNKLAYQLNGSTSALAAPNAVYLQQVCGNTTNGVYWINLPTVGATQIFCILDPACAGGGWMMAMKGTRGTTFNYSSGYWTGVNTLNPTDNTRNDADAKYNTYNYYQAKDWLAIWPDIGNGGDVSGGYGGWTWVENNVTGNSETILTFMNRGIQVTKASNGVVYTATNPGPTGLAKYGNVWSMSGGFQWYGLNYTGNAGTKVRWGWATNNESEQNSNDINGGIGMTYGSFSAGDNIACCATITGINRSARFEWYVR